MLIKKDNNICTLNNEELSYPKNINITEYEIGMDTACVALGINDKAKEIIESQKEWQPNCSIRTGTDGIFGEVYEGKDKNNNLCFLLIRGTVNGDMGYDIDFFKDYLVNHFDIKDFQEEMGDMDYEL